MNWKFSCEAKSEIPLPPEYKFPQAFNYLNSESNSFYILENDIGYIQCAGSKEKCTVEFREYDKNGEFHHYVFYDPSGSDEDEYIQMSNDGVNRKKKHCFNFLTAAKLFSCYFESKEWPAGIKHEEITYQFS